jgi:hypothetical protein
MPINTYPKGSKEKLSKNFSAHEFDCKCKRCKETPISEALVEGLQKMRDILGVPITVKAYRCPEHNAEVKNASKTSLHMYGRAADITAKGIDPEEVAKCAESVGFLGVGLYDTSKDGHFVHVDDRTKKAFWFGHAQEKRTTFGGAPKYTHEQFVREVQEAVGAGVDGDAGPETLSKTVTISANFNRSHAVVKPVQRWLAALGYEEVGEADGIAGTMFTSALTHFQQDNDCTPTGLAEEQGKTWKKLLKLA